MLQGAEISIYDVSIPVDSMRIPELDGGQESRRIGGCYEHLNCRVVITVRGRVYISSDRRAMAFDVVCGSLRNAHALKIINKIERSLHCKLQGCCGSSRVPARWKAIIIAVDPFLNGN